MRLKLAFSRLAREHPSGQVVDTPFNGPPRKCASSPPKPPPITRYLRLHLWDLPKFLNRPPPHPSA